MVSSLDTSDFTVDQTMPIVWQVYEMLQEKIIQIKIKPGEELSETKTAKKFGISRQPMREVLAHLSLNGLVEVRPQRMTVVKKISVKGVLDAHFVHEAVENDIVVELTKMNNQKVIDKMKVLLDQQKKISPTNQVEFMKADEEFHKLMAYSAGRTYAWNVVKSVRSQIDRVRFMSLADMPTVQHESIVSAIASGDVAKASYTIRAHLEETKNSLPIIVAKRPQYFVD